jgi:chromosome segregation ATPase
LAKERDGTTANSSLADLHLEPDFQNIIEKLQRLSSKQQEVEMIKDRQRFLLKHELQAQKTKNDALAKLYNSLRDEHLQLLSTVKALKMRTETASEIEEELINELATVNVQMVEVMEERDQVVKERNQALKAHLPTQMALICNAPRTFALLARTEISQQHSNSLNSKHI